MSNKIREDTILNFPAEYIVSLVTRLTKKLSYRYKIPTDQVNDIAQSVLLKLIKYESGHSSEPIVIEKIEGFIFSVIRNEIFQAFRKDKIFIEREDIDNISISEKLTTSSNIQMKIELQKILNSYLKDLSEQEKIVLHFLTFGYTSIEIARHLGISPVAVRQKVSRLKKKLSDLT